MPSELEKKDTSGAMQPDVISVAQPVNLDKLIAESSELAEQVNGEHTPPQYVTLEAHEAVVAQLNLVTNALNAITERFNQLVEVHQNQQTILSKLTSQQARLFGEPIVTQFVPAQAGHQHLTGHDPNPVALLQNNSLKVPPSLKGVKANQIGTHGTPALSRQKSIGSTVRLTE